MCVCVLREKNEYWIMCFFLIFFLLHCLGWVETQRWTKELEWMNQWRKKQQHNIKINVFTCWFVVVLKFSSFGFIDICLRACLMFRPKCQIFLVWSIKKNGLNIYFFMPRDLMSPSSSTTIFTTSVTYYTGWLLAWPVFCCCCFLCCVTHIESVRFWFNQWKYMPERFPHHFTYIVIIIITIIKNIFLFM